MLTGFITISVCDEEAFFLKVLIVVWDCHNEMPPSGTQTINVFFYSSGCHVQNAVRMVPSLDWEGESVPRVAPDSGDGHRC